MTDQWGRFNKRNRQLVQDDIGFAHSVVVETPTESYQAGVGYTTTYTVVNNGDPIDAEIGLPSSKPDQDAGGTTETADLMLHVPDDTGIDFTGYGESGEATARIKPVDTSKVYEVVTVEDERNGVLVLECEETDT